MFIVNADAQIYFSINKKENFDVCVAYWVKLNAAQFRIFWKTIRIQLKLKNYEIK